jgi:hypothetical protein
MHWIDPQSLPLVTGTVARFLFNPQGQSDGFLFADGQQVHFPPHLSQQLLKYVKVGDDVGVHGLRPRGANVLAAFAITSPAGHCIEDLDAPPHTHSPKAHSAAKSKAVEIRGTVSRRLFAPKGAVCGALLEDGTAIRMHPKGNDALLPLLKPGRSISIWGNRISVHGQQVIDISHLSSAD